MENTVIEIPAELFAPAESSSFTGSYSLPELQAGPDSYRFAAPLRYQVLVSNTGDALLLSGSITGSALTACARCLEDVQVQIDGEVQGYFLIGEEAQPDQDMEGDEFSYLPEDNKLDLAPLLEAAIRVDLPGLPLCKPDCAGICQDCGINLNLERCDCAEKREQARARASAEANPFAVLSQLSFDDEEGIPEAPGARD